jgi:hypothetical protein
VKESSREAPHSTKNVLTRRDTRSRFQFKQFQDSAVPRLSNQQGGIPRRIQGGGTHRTRTRFTKLSEGFIKTWLKPN